MVGLEGVARLEPLPRHGALSPGPGRFHRAGENRARTNSTRPSRRSSCPISPTKSKPISITCRTTISGLSAPGRSSRTSIFFGRSGATFTCATNPPLPRRSAGKRCRQQGHSVVSICTWDRQHLLASIAGAFAVASVNILSADIFVRGDNLALGCIPGAQPETGTGDGPARNRHRRITSANRPPGRTFRFRSAARECAPEDRTWQCRKSISRPESASKTRAILPAP